MSIILYCEYMNGYGFHAEDTLVRVCYQTPAASPYHEMFEDKNRSCKWKDRQCNVRMKRGNDLQSTTQKTND